MKNCYCCGSSEHLIKECPTHKAKVKYRNNDAGKWSEDRFTGMLCPICKNGILQHAVLHTPSLDFTCLTCGKLFELKSKCLSQQNIPNDIRIIGGQYTHLMNSILNKNLNLIILIYKVNEKENLRIERKIIIIENNDLKSDLLNNNINIIQVKNKSKISIKYIRKYKSY